MFLLVLLLDQIENIKLTTDKVMNRDEFDYRVSAQKIVYSKWMDNNPVHIISNFHNTEQTLILRTQRDGFRLELPCPTAVKDYNSYMGEVDKADMLWSIYGVDRKSKKCWDRIFFGLVFRTLCNAYVVYKNLFEPSIRSLEFHRSIAQSLSKQPKVGQPLSTPSHGSVKKHRKVSYSVQNSIKLQNIGAHYAIYKSERGRCEICSKSSIQSRPHRKCYMCNLFQYNFFSEIRDPLFTFYF